MCHDGQGCWRHWTTRMKWIIWERVYNTLISLMPYENILSIVLSAYLNIEFALIPDIKYSLATFASSCQINSICKQQVRSKSVFPALLHMYKCNARRESIILHRETVCSEIWFRITWISWFRSSSISFLVFMLLRWILVRISWRWCLPIRVLLPTVKQMASLCYGVIDVNPLIMTSEVPLNGCQSLYVQSSMYNVCTICTM